MKILVLCTGNSCRSMMAQGFLKHFNPGSLVESAGTQPASRINPFAVKVMTEKGIDISGEHPKLVDEFLNQEFDYVITVCDGANETCPTFIGKVNHRLHIGFEDPSDQKGSEEEVMPGYRKVRDQIEMAFREFSEDLTENKK